MSLTPPTTEALVERAKCGGLPEKDALNLIIRLLAENGTGGGGGSSGGFAIPSYDKYEFTYHGATNNIATQVFSLAGNTVATLTFAYVGGVPAVDDVNLESVTLTLP